MVMRASIIRAIKPSARVWRVESPCERTNSAGKPKDPTKIVKYAGDVLRPNAAVGQTIESRNGNMTMKKVSPVFKNRKSTVR